MDIKKIRIAAVETFYGGSHKLFIEGLRQHSRAEVTLFTLPDSFWKWRMKTGALEIVQEAPDLRAYDLIFVTSLCNVSELRALLGRECPPVILYVHENQLIYPKGDHQKYDFHIYWIDCMNAINADCVVFNSSAHRSSFLSAFYEFLNTLTRTGLKPDKLTEQVKEKSDVIYPGTDTPEIKKDGNKKGTIPRVVWNHRWDHDKQPRVFLEAMLQCADAGFKFELVLLGKPLSIPSEKYVPLIEKLQPRIVHKGYIESREEYFKTLSTGDIVVSTAVQENFGLSIVEAIQCGCFPLLPNRLSYPEIIPDRYHALCLYQSESDLFKALSAVLKERLFEDKTLSRELQYHKWEHRISEYDSLFQVIFDSHKRDRDHEAVQK